MKIMLFSLKMLTVYIYSFEALLYLNFVYFRLRLTVAPTRVLPSLRKAWITINLRAFAHSLLFQIFVRADC